MGTYQTIQDRVARRVIDLPTPVLAEVPFLVNAALRDLQEGHNFRVMETIVEYFTKNDAVPKLLRTVSPSGGFATTPSNFKDFRNEPWFYEYSGARRRMTQASLNSSLTLITNAEVGFPRVLGFAEDPDTAGNNLMVVAPGTDGLSDHPDGEYRIFMPYWKYLPDLVSANDNNWFTNTPSGELFITAWATAEAFSLDWDMENEAKWRAKAESFRKIITKTDKMSRVGAVNELVPHWRGARDNRTRL